MLGGGAKFSQINVAGANTFQAEISLDAAYLIHFGEEVGKFGSLAVGLRPSYSWEPGKSRFKTVVFTRYYYHFKTVSPFAEINLGYRLESTFQPTTNEKTSYSEAFATGAKLGAAFKLGRNVTFDTFFFLDHFNSTVHFIDTPIPSSHNKERTLGLGLQFHIFLLCKK